MMLNVSDIYMLHINVKMINGLKDLDLNGLKNICYIK